MEYKDYYKILNVNRDATLEQIKKQYRILARKYHPDVSKEKNAEEKFKEVREAYDVLKNPEKRKAYDQLGSNAFTGGGFQPPPGWKFQQANEGMGAEQFDTAGFSEFFENLFGQRTADGGRRTHYESHGQRGEDLHSKILLTLEEAYSGIERMITFEEPEQDSMTGQIKLNTRSLKIKIPAGVITGQQIRLVGQGRKGWGQGANGDLFLEIVLADHPFYTVKNRDIYLNLPVTPWEVALGGKVHVPTLAGKIELKIPAGSQAGKKLRLKGRGLPGKSPGDQYVSLTIYTPEPTNEAQRQLYQKMEAEMPYNPRAELMKGV